VIVPPPAASGAFSIELPVRRVITDQTGARHDCAVAKHPCEIVAIDGLDVDYHATAAVAFDASVPPPPAPTLVVQPSTKLPYYARVTTSGAHWNPDDFIGLVECAQSNPEACAFIAAPVTTDDTGTLTGAPMLQRELVDPFDPTAPPVDCAKAKSKCYVEALDSLDDIATVSVTFDPSAPVPPPASVSTTPSPPYRNNAVVQVNGRNFAPKAQFDVSECLVTKHEEDCLSMGSGLPAQTDAAGRASSAFQVQRKMEGFDGGTIDCTSKNVQCFFDVQSEGGDDVQFPITFKTGAGSDTPGTASPLLRSTVRLRSRWLAAATSPAATVRSALRRPTSISVAP
jgi:hypothetical protein